MNALMNGMDRLTILHKTIYSKKSQTLTSVIWKEFLRQKMMLLKNNSYYIILVKLSQTKTLTQSHTNI
jgi:hypothetical protein